MDDVIAFLDMLNMGTHIGIANPLILLFTINSSLFLYYVKSYLLYSSTKLTVSYNSGDFLFITIGKVRRMDGTILQTEPLAFIRSRRTKDNRYSSKKTVLCFFPSSVFFRFSLIRLPQ